MKVTRIAAPFALLLIVSCAAKEEVITLASRPIPSEIGGELVTLRVRSSRVPCVSRGAMVCRGPSLWLVSDSGAQSFSVTKGWEWYPRTQSTATTWRQPGIRNMGPGVPLEVFQPGARFVYYRGPAGAEPEVVYEEPLESIPICLDPEPGDTLDLHFRMESDPVRTRTTANLRGAVRTTSRPRRDVPAETFWTDLTLEIRRNGETTRC